jgi:ClpX C4-type zinc finger protein
VPKPPPVLDSARVLEYAELDSSVGFSGRILLYVDGKELGPAPCLAICQNLREAEILLFHCDLDWTVLGTGGYATVADAKSRAERIYPGVSACWVEAHVSEQEATQYLDELSHDQRCSFCGKRPDQIEKLIEQGDARICNFCIEEFHQMLREESES